MSEGSVKPARACGHFRDRVERSRDNLRMSRVWQRPVFWWQWFSWGPVGLDGYLTDQFGNHLYESSVTISNSLSTFIPTLLYWCAAFKAYSVFLVELKCLVI